MNAKYLLFPILLGGLCPVSNAQAFNSQPKASSSLCFVENKGQVTDQTGKPRKDIAFRLGGNGLSVFVGSGQLHYQWAAPLVSDQTKDTKRTVLYRMDVTLVGADPQAKILTEQQQSFYERYYLPQFGQDGATAYSFQKITYKEVYPNIDWVLYVKDNTVEYDFVVRPGGKVSDIRLQYGGTTDLSLDNAGRLTATSPMGIVTENAPVSFQADGRPVASSFVLRGNTLSFQTAPYSGTLTIDPTLSWSTFYGSTGDEDVRSGCVTGDQSNNGYLGGFTNSTANIATTGAYKDTVTGGTDAFLVKFNSAGVRQWATYYGGTSSETVYGISCDLNNNIYLSGYTNSTTGISTIGSHQPTNGGGSDAFLVKFDSTGNRQWATYYGGSATEQAFAVTCDKSGNVFLGGYTNNSASGIASPGAHQSSGGGGQDAFLVKFNSAGTRQWGTYYGGSSSDRIMGMACDSNKNVFITGYTGSTTGIATSGAHQTTSGGGYETFIVKLDSSGTRQWGTYYGGTGTDWGYGLACDPNGNVYCIGTTTSTTAIATTGSVQDTFGGGASDIFLVKFNPAGARAWASYYGGNATENGFGLCTSASGHVYLIGSTASTSNIATPGTFQDTLNNLDDGILVKWDTSGARIWGTYLGGDGSDRGYGVYVNNLSRVYVGGLSSSFSGLSTAGSHQPINGGGAYDAFLALFNDCLLTAPTAIAGTDTVCRGTAYTYSVPAVAGASSYLWTIPAGWTGSSTTNSISLTAGTNSDTIRVAAIFPCGSSLAIIKAVTVSPLPVIAPAGTINLCSGDSVILSAGAGTTYQWLNGATAISGAITKDYTVHSSGHYAVTVTNAHGCADTSLIDTVILHPLPVPVIMASGAVLSTGSFVSYQWKHNGTAITGAISSSYTITLSSGLYSVTVTDSNGCTGTSAPFDASTLDIQETTGSSGMVSIYPNPVSNMLHIRSDEPINISLSGVDGRTLGYYPQAKHIDMNAYPAGIYLLRITDQEDRYLGTQKIVKQTNR